MYIKLSLIFVVFVLFVAVFLYSTMVKSLRPFLEEATSLVLFCHLLGFSDPTGPSSPKKKVRFRQLNETREMTRATCDTPVVHL